MRTFVIGDIHGAHKALVQCLQRSGFDRAADRLIALGDVCDGWPEVGACFDELLTLRHLDYIIGNHDHWAMEWATSGRRPEIWTSQGGEATLVSYGPEGMPKAHLQLLQKAHWYLLEGNRLFVHGGIDPVKPLPEQPLENFIWDRNLLTLAQRFSVTDPRFRFGTYEAIFVGHTPTQIFHLSEPVKFCNVWAMDTGAGFSGKLSIMDLATKEFWQSDPSFELYPEMKGRMR